MAADFTIKKGDTGPALVFQCYPVERDQIVVGTTTPQDVTGSTVTFTMKKGQGTVIDHQPAVIVDSVNGIVKFVAWGAYTGSAGKRYGWFQVTFADGTKVSFPNDDDPIDIEIES
jgi:hypothetical protein